MPAYYNEHDPQKAAWLRELIRQRVIADGEVDERSITDIQPEDLRGFIQCHFFAGVGVWSYALRLAGWADDRPVWSGSCPCPSFSCAGKGGGFDDPRHLWPAWYRLIPERNPPTIFGEQADDAIGYGWLDLVQTDLERASYSVGKAVLGACSVGAPHIRQRLYFCAHTEHSERWTELEKHADAHGRNGSGRSSDVECSSNRARLLKREKPNCESERSIKQASQRDDSCRHGEFDDGSDTAQRGLAMHRSAPGNAGHAPLTGESIDGRQSERTRLERHPGHERNGRGSGWLDPDTARSVAASGATRGVWADCDWWYGRDGKYRPIEPGLFPLAHGATNRVLKLRGYGDAIVPQTAAEFIKATREAIDDLG